MKLIIILIYSRDWDYDMNIPEFVLNYYNKILTPLIQSKDISFLKESTIEICNHVDKNIVVNFVRAEIWGFLEASFIYHRSIARAFTNLRTYSIVRRNHRNAGVGKKHKIMRIVINGFRNWIKE